MHTQNLNYLQEEHFEANKKSGTAGFFLALLFGGIGLHRFYLEQYVAGFFYLFFSWTFIPALIGFFEAFGMYERVDQYNENFARKIKLGLK